MGVKADRGCGSHFGNSLSAEAVALIEELAVNGYQEKVMAGSSPGNLI
jgi:hypothetical protein